MTSVSRCEYYTLLPAELINTVINSAYLHCDLLVEAQETDQNSQKAYHLCLSKGSLSSQQQKDESMGHNDEL